MAAGGPSRSERKAAERVRRLREEQQRERLRQVRAALTARPAPSPPARPPRASRPHRPPRAPQVSRILRKAAAERSAEEGRLLAESEDLVTELQGRSRRREGLKRRQEEASPAAPRPPPPGRAPRGMGWGGRAGRADDLPGVPAGVRRPRGAAEEGPGAGRRRAERQAPGRLHGRGDQHGRRAGWTPRTWSAPGPRRSSRGRAGRSGAPPFGCLTHGPSTVL